MDVHVSSYLTSQKGVCRSDGFRLLRWGEFLGFSGWADVITGVFIRERGRQESQRRDVTLETAETETLRCGTADFEDGEWRREPRQAGRQPLDFARKHSPLSLQNGCGPDDPVIFSSVRPTLDFFFFFFF